MALDGLAWLNFRRGGSIDARQVLNPQPVFTGIEGRRRRSRRVRESLALLLPSRNLRGLRGRHRDFVWRGPGIIPARSKHQP
ncbi:MAG: hypothetical protein L0191_21760, partial [Acidobacteria bacterium]|nr:hypothetical protein [Acidobacteriota bacterium]